MSRVAAFSTLAVALLAAFVTLSAVEDTKDAETTKVVAEGVGATAKDALEDAFRNAVRQVVGAVIDAESLVKNDEVITDKVLTYSAGFIAKYDQISVKQDKGLFRVKISATVERRGVVAKLKEARVTVKGVEGADIAAAAMTKLEARANAGALLKKALAELPKVLVAEVRKPTAADYDEDKSVLTLDVTVKVDEAKYKAFATNFVQLCDKICLDKNTELLTAEGYNGGETYGIRLPKFFYEDHRVHHPKGWAMAILVDGKGAKSRWNFYILDSNFGDAVSSMRGKMKVGLTLANGQGDKIAEDEFDPTHMVNEYGGDKLVPWLGCVCSGGQSNAMGLVGEQVNRRHFVAGKSGDQVSVELYPMSQISNFKFAHQTYHQTLKLTIDELKSLKDTRCEVSFTPAKAE